MMVSFCVQLPRNLEPPVAAPVVEVVPLPSSLFLLQAVSESATVTALRPRTNIESFMGISLEMTGGAFSAMATTMPPIDHVDPPASGCWRVRKDPASPALAGDRSKQT